MSADIEGVSCHPALATVLEEIEDDGEAGAADAVPPGVVPHEWIERRQ